MCEGSTRLADGRQIWWAEGGDPDGYPVVGLHGTPGCRLSRMLDDSVYAAAGVSYVTTDRAGYGRSTRRPGRCVADEAADVLAVADALGWDTFSVVGGSGGGPHALACAALLGDRVERVACQSSLAPLGPEGLPRSEWLAGMDPEIAAELEWAEAGEAVLHRELDEQQTLMERRLITDPGSLLGEGANPGDVVFLQRPEVIEAFRSIIPEQARNGVWGAVDDTLAFAAPWGFSLASIRVPVLLTYGDEDSSCPRTHGDFLAAHVPSAVVVVDSGGGHFAADPVAEVTATHAWLRSGQTP